MVLEEKHGDIFTTKDKHIIFALNTEGFNDSGFAGQVAKRGFREILNTGGNKLGEVLEKTINGITYHGIVCHSLAQGWKDAPKVVLETLNKMELTDNISSVVFGGGLIGWLQGAPIREIYGAFKKCNKMITIWLN